MEDSVTREKLKSSEFRSIRTEKKLLAGLMRFDEVVIKCFENLNSKVFSSDKLKWVYEIIIDFYNQENELMTEEVFSVCLDKRPKKERSSYTRLFKSVLKYKKSSKRSNCYSYMNKLCKLYEARLMELGMSKSISLLTNAVEGGDTYIDQAAKEYRKIADELGTEKLYTTVTEPISKYEEFKNNFRKIQKDPEKYMGVPTGIQELDSRMHGLRDSEFGLVTAGTGVGKSIMLLDIGFNCFISTGDVVYVTIEMPEDQLRQRFYCRLSGINYDLFRSFALRENDWKKLDRKINNLKNEHPHTFYIVDAPESCDVKTLRNQIEIHIKRHGKPKLIIVDYINIMKGGFNWEAQLQNAVGIKQNIARFFKIPTWSANQLMASKHSTEHIRIEDLGFAKHITDNIDVGIGIAETEMTEDDGLFNIDFTKTRDFSAKGFSIRGNRGLMTFSKAISHEEKVKANKKIGGSLKL